MSSARKHKGGKNRAHETCAPHSCSTLGNILNTIVPCLIDGSDLALVSLCPAGQSCKWLAILSPHLDSPNRKINPQDSAFLHGTLR